MADAAHMSKPLTLSSELVPVTYAEALLQLAGELGVALHLPPLYAREGRERGCPFMDERAVWQLYMRSAIRQVTTAGGVALLPGWQSSPGAILEVFIANNLGIECQPVAVWIKRAEVKK